MPVGCTCSRLPSKVTPSWRDEKGAFWALGFHGIQALGRSLWLWDSIKGAVGLEFGVVGQASTS